MDWLKRDGKNVLAQYDGGKEVTPRIKRVLQSGESANLKADWQKRHPKDRKALQRTWTDFLRNAMGLHRVAY